MTPEEIGSALVAALAGQATVAATDPATEPTTAGAAAGEPTASISGGDRWARATVDVPAHLWRQALEAAKSQLHCDFFDWLCGVDELEHGFGIVAHVWSTKQRHGLLLRTRVAKQSPSIASIVGVYPGASWHERETFEMYGVDFAGHPDLKKLLLAPEFEGHPLRKDFVLASRVAKPWPGAKEPGEGHGDGPKRQTARPPGVPAPGEWGPPA